MTDAEWLRQEADGFDSKYAPTDAKAKRLQAVLRRAALALDVLRDVEWSGERDGDSCCPECRGYEFVAHEPDCRLVAAIGETP